MASLENSPSCSGPWHSVGVLPDPVAPGDLVAPDVASGPEVLLPVAAHDPDEVVGLLPGVQ